MTKIAAVIERIESVDTLYIVTFRCDTARLKMMSLELSDAMGEGAQVLLQIKPTAVAVGKGDTGMISIVNRIDAVVTAVEKGALLCRLDLACLGTTLEAIVTTEAAEAMELRQGDTVAALVKAADIAIERVTGA